MQLPLLVIQIATILEVGWNDGAATRTLPVLSS